MSPRLTDERARAALLGSNIKELRIRMRMTEAALGEKIGVNQKQMSRYETGDNSLPLGRIPDLCAALGVGVAEVFKTLVASPETRSEEQPARDLWTARITDRISRLPQRHRQIVSRLIDDLSASDLDEPKRSQQ